MDIGSLADAYRSGVMSPTQAVHEIYDQIAQRGERPVWITLVPREANVARARWLASDTAARSLPLYGIPFAVKDNLDVAGLPTTAACPGFSRVPDVTATVVQKLLDAGAILIGKTNMDQFATGLVGTRSPYGSCSSVFDAERISGGSSSGSAVAVAQGLVSFSLGTDTAGSGRVPAAFNQLVGLKPTRGRLSARGLVPACRTLDCVSVFAETCADAARVFTVARGFDAGDPYSRVPSVGQDAAPWSGCAKFRVGVPDDDALEFFGDVEAGRAYEKAVRAISDIGGEIVRFDYAPFRKAANLLYQGPWVAERLAAIREFLSSDPDSLDPTVGAIIQGGAKYSAVDSFEAMYALQELRSETSLLWEKIDLLLLPTAPTHYSIEQVRDSPIELNAKLGYYTNFVNLLDLAAVAVPAGMKANGLPFGVTLIGPAFTDEGLLRVADRLHRRTTLTLGGSRRRLDATSPIAETFAPPGCIAIAVVGAHLVGQPLNWQLIERKARLLASTRTSAEYRLFALANTEPAKPGLVYEPGFEGEGIEVEVWAMPEQCVGSFLQAIPSPLGLGTIRLMNGSQVRGFLCEPAGMKGAEEITHLGGWRDYLLQRV